MKKILMAVAIVMMAILEMGAQQVKETNKKVTPEQDTVKKIDIYKEFELNFIERGKGVRRIVGDSVEEIGDYELVLLGGEDLEHFWDQGSCRSEDIREITIQFSGDIFGAELLSKNQFASIKRMLRKAGHGLSFSLNSIMKVYSTLDTIAIEQEKFVQFLKVLYILYELSISDDARVLASTSFAHARQRQESDRVQKVKQYIYDHYLYATEIPIAVLLP